MTDDNGTENKSAAEQAMELLLYAPVGFALEARDLLPQLVERGRQQVTLAKMMGQFAVQMGQKEATKALGKAGEQANTVLNDLGLLGRPSAPRPPSTRSNGRSPAPSGSASSAGSTSSAAGAGTEPSAGSPAGSPTAGSPASSSTPGRAAARAASPTSGQSSGRAVNGTSAAGSPSAAGAAPAPAGAGGLAIADYDSLAASQVIPRLPGLAGDELEAVRVYEDQHRGRKTILNRIAQLQSA